MNAPPGNSRRTRRNRSGTTRKRSGLTPDEMALCDATVTIPMVGCVDSHNLAVAASLVLYEVFYQRRIIAAVQGDGGMNG
ncbi:MAG: TrmH family RNA methyltransferase [Armatimonadota bacterium]